MLTHSEAPPHGEDWHANWRFFADSIPETVLLVGRDGTILQANRHLPLGLAPNAVIGANVLDFALSESRDMLRQALTDLFEHGTDRTRVERAILPDGSTRWYSLHTGPLLLDKRIVAAVIVARDITETRRARVALDESEARFRTLIEHAPEAIVVYDVDQCRFVEGNRNACELFGVTFAELMRSNPVELSPSRQPDGQASDVAASHQLAAALNGETPTFEWMHRTRAGIDVRCEVRLVKLPSATSRLIRGSIIDVTQRRRMEEQMHEWQKMDAIGQLAAGIAHDFNNVLAVVTMSAQVMIEDLAPGSVMREDAERIATAARQGAALTAQLLSFARPDKTTASIVDLNDVVRDVVAMTRRVVPDRICLVERLCAEGAAVRAGRSQLEQIVMNLLLNARDAIPEAGSITLETASNAGTIRLTVKDTGVGMSDETKRRIFEPFFTTKAEKGGSGIGLSTVYAIVRSADGSIMVESCPNQGATFTVTLPVACAEDTPGVERKELSSREMERDC